MDFTLKTYEKLLNALLARGFSFMTFAQFIESQETSKSHKLLIFISFTPCP